MSTTDKPTPITPSTTVVNVNVEKQSFFQKKVVAPIKRHPKLATAIAGGVALVGGAAYLGRKSAPSIDTDPVQYEGTFVEPSSEEDATVA